MSGSPGGRARFLVRRFVLGSGPLKRTSDRVQMVARVVVLLAVLAAPAVAVVAAGAARQQLGTTAAAQAADRHRVRAVVTGTSTTTVQGESGGPPETVVRATVSWPGPHGAPRHANVPAPHATRVGSAVPLWVDRAGRPTVGPLDRASIEGAVTAVALGTVVAVPLVAWGGYGVLCLGLGLHRRRRWTRDWARAEREWRTGSTGSAR